MLYGRLFVKKTFEVFGLNYDAVFEDGGQIIFWHIYIIRRSSSNVLLRK